MTAIKQECFICIRKAPTSPCTVPGLDYRVDCPRCGLYYVGRATGDDFESAGKWTKENIENPPAPAKSHPEYKLALEIAKHGGIGNARSLISHVVKKALRPDGRIFDINADVLIGILKNNPLPTPAEQANNLIMLIAENQPSIGHAARVEYSDYGLIGLGIISQHNEEEVLNFLYEALKEQGFLTENSRGQRVLSLKGWQKYEELKRSIKNSKKAFVAMEFPDDEKRGKEKDYFFQDKLLDTYLVSAVKETGFDLGNPLRSDPKAGNLHARLEVEIRQSRFVVAELSDANNGAYWEAGFAKGLGKPVIYMCEKKVKRHFDVGSDYIVLWERDKPENAAAALQDVIRATLFGEAA